MSRSLTINTDGSDAEDDGQSLEQLERRGRAHHALYPIEQLSTRLLEPLDQNEPGAYIDYQLLKHDFTAFIALIESVRGWIGQLCRGDDAEWPALSDQQMAASSDAYRTGQSVRRRLEHIRDEEEVDPELCRLLKERLNSIQTRTLNEFAEAVHYHSSDSSESRSVGGGEEEGRIQRDARRLHEMRSQWHHCRCHTCAHVYLAQSRRVRDYSARTSTDNIHWPLVVHHYRTMFTPSPSSRGIVMY